MLVVEPTRPTTFTASPRRAIASMAPSTPAAPHMSYFIHSMLAAGLMEIPPESKHSPLPTSTTGLPFLGPFRYSSAMSLGSCGVPWATARNDPIPSFSMSARPSTVHGKPCRLAMSRAVSARKSGVQRLPGIIPSVRASDWPSPIAVPVTTPRSAAARSGARTVPAASAARRSSAGGGVLTSS